VHGDEILAVFRQQPITLFAPTQLEHGLMRHRDIIESEHPMRGVTGFVAQGIAVQTGPENARRRGVGRAG